MRTDQIKDMNLSMRPGKSRHYKVSEIQGWHCFETGLAAGFSREQVASILTDMHSRAEQAFATALDDMPAGFREARFASVGRVFGPRRTSGLADQKT
jgi:serine/threonine-protein kinase HipA